MFYRYMVILCLIINLLLSGQVFGRELSGEGQAVLGNGITIEQAQIIALMNAQKDALTTFDDYIKSAVTADKYDIEGTAPIEDIRNVARMIAAAIIKTTKRFFNLMDKF